MFFINHILLEGDEVALFVPSNLHHFIGHYQLVKASDLVQLHGRSKMNEKECAMNRTEQSIKLVDVLHMIFSAWRKIIVFALLGALLLSGYGIYTNYQISKGVEPSDVIALTDKEVEDIKKDARAQNVDILQQEAKIKSLTTRLETLSGWMANSILLTIDENAQPRASIEITTWAEEPTELAEDTLEQRNYRLSVEILRKVKNDDYYKYIAQVFQKKYAVEWLSELVTSRRDPSNVVTIEIVGPNEEMVTTILEATKRYFSSEARATIEVEYLYDISFQNEKREVVKNPSIAVMREELQQEIDDISDRIMAEREVIDAILEQILQDANIEKQAEKEPTPLSAKQIVLKRALPGLVFGLFFAVLWVLSKMSYADVVRQADGFSVQMNLLFLGSISSENGTTRTTIFSGIDRWIDRIFSGKNERYPVAYLTSIIDGIKPDDRPVAIMAEPSDASSGLVTSLHNAKLADLTTEEGVKALQDSHYAILVIQPGKTKSKDAVRALEIADKMGKTILGVVSEEHLHEA